MLHHVALTSNLPVGDPKKFKMGTPKECGDNMDRTWEVYPTLERVVQDILKFPRALDAIILEEGGVVEELTKLTGRRKELHLDAFPHHPDCAEAVKTREAKWDAEEEKYGHLAQQDDVQDEEVSESDDEVSDDE